MKRATTGWPVNGRKTRLHPGHGRDGRNGWTERRKNANALACITGYAVKAERIAKNKGKHNAVCNPQP